MAVTVKTKVGYGSRIGDAFKGILTGIGLVVAGIVLLWWNEGRTVKRAKALKEGSKAVIPVSSETIDPANDGKLIHTTGMTVVNSDLVDSEMNLTVEKCIRLDRIVEMYQWVEDSDTTEEKKLGGSVEKTTVYTYSKDWCKNLVDSSHFQEEGHDNPTFMPFKDRNFIATEVTLGAFRLNSSQIQAIGQEHDYVIPQNYTAPTIPGGVYAPAVNMNGQLYYQVRTQDITQELKEKAVDAISDAAVEAATEAVTGKETVVKTQKLNAVPQIGDIRVTFRVVMPHDISVVAQQTGDTFCAYQAKTGTVILQKDGIHSADEMFQSAQDANKFMGWILRLVGFLLIYFGFQTIFKLASVLADVVPFIGNIVGMATSFISFLLALPIALLVIALAWLFYRPVLAIFLLIIVAGCVFALIKAFPKKKA